MLEHNTKIHNRFTIEIKLGYHALKKQTVSDFAVNTWIFIPNSLDVNQNTYDKKDFYRDLKSNIRLITPIFLLSDIAKGKNSPFIKLEAAIRILASLPNRTNTRNFEHQLKMLLSIVKSALREETQHIIQNEKKEDKRYLLDDFLNHTQLIANQYRNTRRLINVATINKEIMNYFQFGDEFLSNIIEKHAFTLLQKGNLLGKSRKNILAFINQEVKYKVSKGYPVVDPLSPDANRLFVHHSALLKKYAENVLFVAAHKKRDGILKEQILYSLAAGLSMVFATAIAFSFQAKYGNLTMPFFVALVVSYMLKDRIKELGRIYFAHKTGRSYFDHKTSISLSNQHIGWSKEAMDFVEEAKVPQPVIRMRKRSAILEADNRNNDEKILLYRKRVRIFRKKLDQSIDYNTKGINEILRLNLQHFCLQMDDPDIHLHVEDAASDFKTITGERIYFLNLLMQLKSNEETIYHRYRIALNKNGIAGIETFPML